MRLHTDLITEADINGAGIMAGVVVHQLTKHGSRSRDHAWNLYLEGSGRRGGQWGHFGEKAATWDEWGIFLARLYTKDPDMRIAGVYENEEHFHWATGSRYRTLTPDQQHHHARWMGNGQSVTGRYYVHQCSGCEAIQRRLAPGLTWARFAR